MMIIEVNNIRRNKEVLAKICERNMIWMTLMKRRDTLVSDILRYL